MFYENDDVRIQKIKELLPPVALMERFPASDNAAKTVYTGRQSIHNIFNNKDDRLLVIIGPCSIHDPIAAIEYGERLVKLRKQYQDNLEIVMRVYFEKPRTTVG
ncbi:MAG: 3-deoxy-7-phosphoheptulonate synthase, partial [Gammaproteobacteria bacterium]